MLLVSSLYRTNHALLYFVMSLHPVMNDEVLLVTISNRLPTAIALPTKTRIKVRIRIAAMDFFMVIFLSHLL